jgi:signal transduction histidine kinase
MLSEFIQHHRYEILSRTRLRVSRRLAPRATESELEHGIPLFLEQLVAILEETTAGGSHPEMARAASAHGGDRLRSGFTVDQLVHDYGDVCQAVTGLAADLDMPIPTVEFRSLNLCLDTAIARAVTEYQVQREANLRSRETERTGFLAHELRNLLSTAGLSFHMLKRGDVAINGSTGKLLERSLRSMAEMVDRSLARVRADEGLFTRESTPVCDLMEELRVAASFEAGYGGHTFTASPVDPTLMLETDRMLIAAAVTNLLRNAFKFTRLGGTVSLRALEIAGRRLRIEVGDECGGLPGGATEKLFTPFVQVGADRSGLGLGLTISRESVRAGGGELTVQDLPGKGCIFTVELPLAPSRPRPSLLPVGT